MKYQAKAGDSPSRIARAYGVPMSALLNANPHKPTTVVAGQRTWRSLAPRETIIVPVGGMVAGALGDTAAAVNAITALVGAGSPCDQAFSAIVCDIQRALGVTADGKWGNDTATAARAIFAGAPAACSPRPSWWAPKGQSNCGAVSTPLRTSAPAPSSSSLDTAASAALAALLGDSNYCVSVKRAGSPVNTAIHNFKAAWNAANPTNRVPINTGNYEPIVQLALGLALNVTADNIPPGCGAVPGAPPPPAPAPAPAPIVTPVPGPSTPTVSVPAPVAALATVDPCAQSSLDIVYAAQRALGVSADGKYGNDTATAARRLLPTAPAGCSPRPAWWAPKGQSNLPGGNTVPTPPPRPPQPAPTVVVPVPVPGPTPGPAPGPSPTPGQPIVVAPEPAKKLSTGAIVAGAVGAVALVGLIAVAATGKKGHRGARGPSGHSHGRHKSTHKRKSSHRARRH